MMGIRIVLVVAALVLSACGSAAPAATAEATEATKTAEPPAELALFADEPLCIQINHMLDNLLVGNIGSASDYTDLEQQLPAELRGQATTGPIPTISATSRAEAAAVDAHTTGHCGVPFVRSAIHISITCEVVGSAEMFAPYLSDWGACSDPRVEPGSALPLSELMDELEVLEQAISGRSN